MENKSDIEFKLGDGMEFFKDENVKLAAISLIKEINSDIMNLDHEIREELINWSVKWMPKFRAVFDPLIDKDRLINFFSKIGELYWILMKIYFFLFIF